MNMLERDEPCSECAFQGCIYEKYIWGYPQYGMWCPLCKLETETYVEQSEALAEWARMTNPNRVIVTTDNKVTTVVTLIAQPERMAILTVIGADFEVTHVFRDSKCVNYVEAAKSNARRIHMRNEEETV